MALILDFEAGAMASDDNQFSTSRVVTPESSVAPHLGLT
jgi:hypothetical protein